MDYTITLGSAYMTRHTYRAQCHTCRWLSTSSNAPELASLHAKNSGHFVTVDINIFTCYNKPQTYQAEEHTE